ncbi:MAG: serine/threonine protein kinase [Planctomycetota bacterium]
MRKFIQCKLCGIRHPVTSNRGEALLTCRGCGRELRARLPIFNTPESTFWANDTLPLDSWSPRKSSSSGCWNQGRRFGPYQVIEEIARGGMGTVYKARHVGLNRVVALKILQGDRDRSGEMAARFRKEARTTANLRHKNIIPVFDVGHISARLEGGTGNEEVHYYAMEYVEGETLDERMFKSMITREDALRVVVSISRALDEVHGHRIVHRDVKPGNIILDRNGRPYLMDFGLAKEIDAAYRITRPGMAMGTPAYMSPEQAEGDGSIDGRADVYSLGALIFEILAGRPPFKGASLMETMMQVVSEKSPSLREHEPRIDADLEAICMKCLEKDRTKRYATAGELADDLEAFLDGKPVKANPSSLHRQLSRRLARSKNGAILAAGFATAAATVAAFITLL